MQKSKLQNILFTIVMAFVMVYAMVCYNIALDKGQMSNEIFLIAFHEIPIMWPIACILEYFVVEKLAAKLAFRFVSPQDKPIFITLAISSMIVCLMCPTMSFIATLLFMNPGKEIIALWLQKWVQNFPMALCWQIFFAGPGVRNFFRLFEGKKKAANETVAEKRVKNIAEKPIEVEEEIAEKYLSRKQEQKADPKGSVFFCFV